MGAMLMKLKKKMAKKMIMKILETPSRLVWGPWPEACKRFVAKKLNNVEEVAFWNVNTHNMGLMLIKAKKKYIKFHGGVSLPTLEKLN